MLTVGAMKYLEDEVDQTDATLWRNNVVITDDITPVQSLFNFSLLKIKELYAKTNFAMYRTGDAIYSIK